MIVVPGLECVCGEAYVCVCISVTQRCVVGLSVRLIGFLREVQGDF